MLDRVEGTKQLRFHNLLRALNESHIDSRQVLELESLYYCSPESLMSAPL